MRLSVSEWSGGCMYICIYIYIYMHVCGERGAGYLTGENLKVVWAEFSAQS